MTSYLQHCPTDKVASTSAWWEHSNYRCHALHCSCPLCLTMVLSKPDSIKWLSASLGDKKRENLAVISSKACLLASRLGTLKSPQAISKDVLHIPCLAQTSDSLMSRSSLEEIHTPLSTGTPDLLPVNNSVDDVKKGEQTCSWILSLD